jgi:hypothetical protein
VRHVWKAALGVLVGCGEAPPAKDEVLLLTVDVALTTRHDLAAVVDASVRRGATPPEPERGTCARVRPAGAALDRDARLTVAVGDRVPLQHGAGGHGARFGVLDRDLAWSPVALTGSAPGGWMVDERSAAQVPEAPAIDAVETRWWGAVDLFFEPGPMAPTSVWVAAPGGAWRCAVAHGFARVPAWLARGDVDRVAVEQARHDRHRTPDGDVIIGVARVRVPVRAALPGAPDAAAAVAGLSGR